MKLEQQSIQKLIDNFNAKEDDDNQYLCRMGGNIFVSCLGLTNRCDHTMPANCENGCIYVNDSRNKYCYPVDHLEEIHKITNTR